MEEFPLRTVELVIDEVKPYSKNPRMNQDAIAKVADSIREYGFQQPIVVDKNKVIIVGHTRYLAAKELGMKKVPVVVADKLTPKQVKAYRIADNKVAEYSDWDNELLKGELKGLDDIFTGFTEPELLNLFNAESLVEDHKDEWDGMPEFNQDDKMWYRQIIVNFEKESDFKKFQKLVDVEFTEKTKSFIYPPRKRSVLKDKGYVKS